MLGMYMFFVANAMAVITALPDDPRFVFLFQKYVTFLNLSFAVPVDGSLPSSEAL